MSEYTPNVVDIDELWSEILDLSTYQLEEELRHRLIDQSHVDRSLEAIKSRTDYRPLPCLGYSHETIGGISCGAINYMIVCSKKLLPVEKAIEHVFTRSTKVILFDRGSKKMKRGSRISKTSICESKHLNS